MPAGLANDRPAYHQIIYHNMAYKAPFEQYSFLWLFCNDINEPPFYD
jgi:hypothetical protein